MTIDNPLLHRRSQLLADGLTDRELRGMIRTGELVTVRPGSYTTASTGNPEERHRLLIRASVPSLARGAVVSHVSAAVWYRLPVWAVQLDQVHVTRARHTGGRINPRVHMYSAPLGTSDVVEINGLAVTSPARTLIDLARTVSFESAVVTLDAALRSTLVSPSDLERSVGRAKGWQGCPRARRAVAFADGRSESVGESRSRVAIAKAGLPDPVLQWEVRDGSGQLVARTDFGWPHRGVVGEFDGKVKYGRLLSPGQWPGDAVFAEKLREDELRAENLTVIRWTWPDIPTFALPGARLHRALT